jgi:hypothetical protein
VLVFDVVRLKILVCYCSSVNWCQICEHYSEVAHGRVKSKFDEMRRNRPGPNSKIGEFWNLNLIFLKKIKKYVKN